MKKKTTTVSLKKQLASAVSMMLAAAVALGSSTYAWFVNRSRAEVKDVLFQASAGKNLEIAAAVAESGNSLDLSDGDQIPYAKAKMLTYYSTVTPEILGANSFTYPAFVPGTATTNYMTPVSTVDDNLTVNGSSAIFFENAGWDTESTGINGYDTYTAHTGQTGDDKYYICAQLYFRASEAMDVYLNKAEWNQYKFDNDARNGIEIPYITQYKTTEMSNDLSDTYKMQAEDLAKSLRISFVVAADESIAEENKSIKTACFDASDTHVTGATWNTFNSEGTGLITADTPIKSINSSTNKVSTFGDAVTTTLTTYSLENASVGDGTNTKTVDTTNKTPLFSLKANEPKRVTIYIWLEGTDQDCVNTVSSYIAGVYLPFVGTVATTNDDGDTEYSTYSLKNPEPIVETETETVEAEAETSGYVVDEVGEEPETEAAAPAEGEEQTSE